ncbi:kinesin-like protein [Hibiscus syriacus]|uniref:Kinesin-like protein n=1 Tax=Hibiscus syriacus TaxID=106335 RepID=A0A6A2WYJ7_HIBSY|nr:kinesin-like protein [Hibiscus syriacus]
MMAIEKNNFKVSRFDSEFSPGSRETTVSSDEDELQRQRSVVVSDGEDDDGGFDDADSGAGSDDYDLLELGETGAEFCQVGNSTCSMPFELYDLPGLEDILSLDVWNECLSDEERFSLTKFLPDMEQDTFMWTLNDLLKGYNFHFGSPIKKLFDMLKGGLCEPKVALYREGLNFFQKRHRYHHLRKHQNNMVVNLCQIRDAWVNCRGYSIEERLRVLNIMRSQKSLVHEKLEDEDSESSKREDLGDGLWSKKVKDRKASQQMTRYFDYEVEPNLEFISQGQLMALEPAKYGKLNPKGKLKTGGSKFSSAKEFGSCFYPGLDMNSEPYDFSGTLPRQKYKSGIVGKSGSLRAGKKYDHLRVEELASDSSLAFPFSSKQEFEAYVGKQKKSLKGRNPPFPLKGSRVDLSEGAEIFGQNKYRGEDFSVDSSPRSGDQNIRSKKWRTGRESPGLGFRSRKVPSPMINDRFLQSDSRMKPLQEKIRGNYVRDGETFMALPKGSRAFFRNEETESDSSEQFNEDEDSNPLMRSKLAYPSGVIKDFRLSSLKSGLDSKKTKSLMKNSVEDRWTVDGITRFSKKRSRENVHVPVENYYLKGKQKGKMHEKSPLLYSASSILDDVDRKQVYESGKDDRLKMSSLRVYPTEKRQKGELAYDQSMSQSKYLLDHLVDEEDASPVTGPLTDANIMGRTGKKGKRIEAYDRHEKSAASSLGCNKVTKKRTGKEYVAHVDGRGEDLQANLQQQTDDSLLLKKGKLKLEVDTGTLDIEASEGAEAGVLDVEMEAKAHKNLRLAMITPLPEDSLEVNKPREEQNGQKEGGVNGVLFRENVASNNLDHPVQASVPSLTVHEIVSCVTVNPGDPSPLGAKGWKALVAYEKSTKSWSWVGPVAHSSNYHEAIEEVTSPEAWGLPHKMLVKLVDSFASWLKNGQETLQQIGSLPAPPLELMQVNLDEKERFRDLRAQKSLNTISPSSEEVRAYFQREELLRYSIPDRAFSYTASDGKKSIVAPLRRCGGKPTSKARDHFMLKRDRPPHVTILCIVRDAAARLPGSIGTRADVCTLIRDSQYIVEDVSDAQVNQVVSGALDRLHYERDPCVQFDGERKLWVYLHREREEEDFEDDGTSSTKKWKRQKKDTVEQTDQGAVTVAFHSTGDQSGLEWGSDLNAEPPCTDGGKKMETDFHDGQNMEYNADTAHGSELANTQHGHPESKLLRQENSTNEEFDDNAFGGERPVGLPSASLS